ncbi:MAG: hypothetical protein ABI665_10970 [Vicinamibacterales bacterium]
MEASTRGGARSAGIIEALYIETVPSFDPLSRLLGGLAAILGLAATWVYVSAGLSLSHYDAKAHLVVARRILDSLTPSWEQIGAVWLPLPHVLNALPVQIDFFYRTGASAIAMSVVSFAITAACLSAIVMKLTGSRAGATLAAALFALNPDVLYLQSTPMTEPLLFGLTALVVLHLTEWALQDAVEIRRAAGWTIVLAALTRYEAWPVIAAAMVASAFAKWRRGTALPLVVGQMLRLAVYPAGAVVFFVLMSRITTSHWFVTGGFFVPDPELQGRPTAVWDALVKGTEDLGGTRLVAGAMILAMSLVVIALVKRAESALLMSLALLAAGALPCYAYFSGHPFRIRYEVPLVVGCALVVGTGVGLLQRLAPFAAAAMLAAVLLQVQPFDRDAPMLREAQLDRANGIGRRQVTACLRQGYDGTSIMASMGALAHYMQELSLEGFNIADFIHEGSGPLWDFALSKGPASLAGWVLVEEVAEGGDVLYQRQKAAPFFLDGFDRICEGGNVALYRRR